MNAIRNAIRTYEKVTGNPGDPVGHGLVCGLKQIHVGDTYGLIEPNLQN